jgi:hypothetical protein
LFTGCAAGDTAMCGRHRSGRSAQVIEGKSIDNDTSTKNAPAAAPVMEKPDANALRSFPFYEEGKVPQYQKYHAKVSNLDELELIWGKRWGAQGIGR